MITAHRLDARRLTMTPSPPLQLPGLSWLLMLMMMVMCLAPLHCFIPQQAARIGERPDPPPPPTEKDCSSKPDNHSCKESQLHQNEVFIDHGVPHRGILPADEVSETEILEEIVESEEEELTTRRKRSYRSEGQGHEVPNRRKKRGIIINDPVKYWTNGIVPYVIDRSKLDEGAIISIKTATAFMEKYTCIRYVPWNSTTKALYGLANDGRLVFTVRSYCSSFLGNDYASYRHGQTIMCCHTHACIHELGHALGLRHEHAHYDKDILRKDWMRQDPHRTWTYAEVQKGEARFTKYDLSSPMHYAWYDVVGFGTLLFPELTIKMRFKYFFEIISDTYQCQARNCSHFTRTCHNSGIVALVEGKCGCLCPRGLDPRTDCATVRTKTERRTFPGGSYAIPSPRDGCPPGHGFQTEVLTVGYNGFYDFGSGELLDSWADNTLTSVLCTRHSTDTNAMRWPPGQYCVYRVGVCPPEFEYSNLTMETTNTTTSGNFSYVDKGRNYVTFHFCCRTEAQLEPIEMFNTQPFALLRRSRHGCEHIAGMRVLEQSYLVKDPMVYNLYNGPMGFSRKGASLYRFANGNTYLWFCYYYPVSDNTLPLSPCEDGHANCSRLAHNGQCHNAQVAKNCPYSCNTCSGVKGVGDCVDIDKDCQLESCSTYSDSKRQNCKLTCRRCTEFCGGIIKLTRNASVATISSPGYPQNYKNNLDCFWQITGPPDSTLLLTMTDFDVEGTPNRCKDKLEVNHARIDYEGNYFCGTEFSMTIRSIYNEMEVRFHTDYRNERRGFNATVRLALPKDHCFDPHGRGQDYRGNVSYTRDWKPCVPWNQTTNCKHHTFAPYDLTDDLRENFCRNPGNGMRPWCYTSTKCDRNYCDVCFLETPYDTASDCLMFRLNGYCYDDPVEARRKCAKTCAKVLPARIKPPAYTTVKCGPPSPPADADSGYNLTSEYAVGENVSFTCRDNSHLIRQTTCMPNGKWSPLGYVCGGCPNGWTFHDDSCFLEVNTGMTYDNARAHCLSLQAHVAEARREEDIRFLIQLKDDGRYQWISLRKDANSCFRWEDGTRPSWTKWDKRGGADGECVAVSNALQLIKWSCTGYNLFVCQRPALNSSVCADFLPDCASQVQKSPSKCQEPDFAKFSCPKTCYGNSSCQDPCASSPCLNGGKCYVRGGTFQCVCSKNYNGTQCEELQSCRDEICDCELLKLRGWCDYQKHKQRHYGLKFCSDTCSKCGQASECSDKQAYCSQISPSDCATNASHVDNCRKSCGLCTDGPTCIDRHEQCGSWIDQGQCNVNSTVRRLCPNGCNLCFNPNCYDNRTDCSTRAPAYCAGDALVRSNCHYGCHQCSTGFKCYSQPCQNNGTCSEDSGAAAGYTCDCTGTGFSGPTCEQQSTAQHSLRSLGRRADEARPTFTMDGRPDLVPKCSSQTCKNNGMCSENSETFIGFTCDCSGTGFTGPTCEQPEPKCNSQPCHNNGMCIEDSGAADGYTCDCSGTGFTGPTCEQPEPKCNSQPCQNNGMCSEDSGAADGYTCDCSGTGFTGPTCEQPEPKCSSQPCKNGGTCSEDSGAADGYTCDCSGTGFTGPTCEQPEPKCNSQPCHNNGMCSEDSGAADGYTCDCSGTGFTGPNCEQPQSKCFNRPCQNNGMCNEDSGAAGGYTCDCSGTGFTGPTCEQRIVQCAEGWKLQDGFCYKFFNTKKTYDDAKASCSSAMSGAKIPIISSVSENAFIHNLAGNKSQWLNARRSDSKSQFKWSDGSLVSDGFSYWAPNHPKNNENNCACLRRADGRWRVFLCIRKRKYVCKVKAS